MVFALLRLASPQGRDNQQESHLTRRQHIHCVDLLAARTPQLSLAGKWVVQDPRLPSTQLLTAPVRSCLHN